MRASQLFPINVYSAGGGHGATTVTGAIGAFLGVASESRDPAALEWIWGLPKRANDLLLVRDLGRLEHPMKRSGTNVIVIRGPCSVGVRILCEWSSWVDHLILIREPWRAIKRIDLESAVGVQVAVEIPHSSNVARLADAGLLPDRVESLEEFRELKLWTQALLTPQPS